MTVAASARFACRCTHCYQTLLADIDAVGSPMECRWCGATITIPAATAEGIERAAAFEKGELALEGCQVTEDASCGTAAERRELAKRLARDQGKSRDIACKNPASRSASRFARLLAYLADLFVTSLVCFLCLRSALTAYQVPSGDMLLRAESLPLGFWLLAYGIPGLLTLFYWFTISAYGKTVGKYLLNIRIVDGAGNAPGWVRGVAVRHSIAIVTTLVPWIPVLNYAGYWPEAWSFSTRTGYDIACIVCFALALADVFAIALEPPRCLHDRLAGTYVVDG